MWPHHVRPSKFPRAGFLFLCTQFYTSREGTRCLRSGLGSSFGSRPYFSHDGMFPGGRGGRTVKPPLIPTADTKPSSTQGQYPPRTTHDRKLQAWTTAHRAGQRDANCRLPNRPQVARVVQALDCQGRISSKGWTDLGAIVQGLEKFRCPPSKPWKHCGLGRPSLGGDFLGRCPRSWRAYPQELDLKNLVARWT